MINSNNMSAASEENRGGVGTNDIATSSDSANGNQLINRAELIQRMLREALDEPSAVAANLQVNGADLLEMSLVLKSAILSAADSTHDVHEIRELLPFIDMYAKLCRQADRVLRLKSEVTPSRQDERSAPANKSTLENE